MKKPVTEYTDDEIAARLALADRIAIKLPGTATRPAGVLPDHLEVERQELLGEQRRRRQCCKLCRWFDPDFVLDENEAEALGLCKWPAERLPHSLKFGNRERVAVGPLEGKTCPTYEEPAR